MTMRRRHFELIAETIEALDNLTPQDHLYVAVAFAEMCDRTNVDFDVARFLTACGVEA